MTKRVNEGLEYQEMWPVNDQAPRSLIVGKSQQVVNFFSPSRPRPPPPKGVFHSFP